VCLEAEAEKLEIFAQDENPIHSIAKNNMKR
jgi:hypothetical protein